MTLPPGQRAIEGFPRFGTHLHQPAPHVPADPAIEVVGGEEDVTVPVSALADLPRRELIADFHCVAGWTSVGRRWEGVGFADFYRAIVEPVSRRDAPVTHLTFGGHDGYGSVVGLEDAMADDVLIADRLDGRPLDDDHGAPARFVSPSQYGFVSTKHLCRVELHPALPTARFGHVSAISWLAFRTPLFRPHARARVWKEERHAFLPGRAVRPLYGLLVPPIAFLSGQGAGRDG